MSKQTPFTRCECNEEYICYKHWLETMVAFGVVAVLVPLVTYLLAYTKMI